MNGFEARFIELAGHVNESMPRFVVERSPTRSTGTARACADRASTSWASPTRRGVNDVRESPALNVMKMLDDKGAVLSYSDPYIPDDPRGGLLARLPCPLGNGYAHAASTASWC